MQIHKICYNRMANKNKAVSPRNNSYRRSTDKQMSCRAQIQNRTQIKSRTQSYQQTHKRQIKELLKLRATAGLLRAMLKLNLQIYVLLLALALVRPSLAGPHTTSLINSNNGEYNSAQLIYPPGLRHAPRGHKLAAFKSSAEKRSVKLIPDIFLLDEGHVTATPRFNSPSQLSVPSLNQLQPKQADLGAHREGYLHKLRLNTAVSNKFQQLELEIQHSPAQSGHNQYQLQGLEKENTSKSDHLTQSPSTLLTHKTTTNIRHSIELSKGVKLTTTAYHNRFQQDWFKTDNTTNLIDRANHGDNQAQAILDGIIANSDTAGQYSQNYNNRGVAAKLDLKLGIHQLELGAQLQKDHIDSNRADNDFYSHDSSSYIGDTLIRGENTNQEDAQAHSVYLLNQWRLSKQLGLSFGLRYEDISTSQTRSREINYSQQSDDLLWSGGITYQLNYNTQLLAGVHTGFNPALPNSSKDIQPETSTNYEAGVRFNHGNVSASAIGFFSDYNNTINHCSEAFPCGEQTAGSTTLGESEVKGLELSLDMIAFDKNDISLPISISYTFTEAEITKAQDNTISTGEAFEHLPENVVNAQLGLEMKSGWKSYISASYIDEICTKNNNCDRHQKSGNQIKTEDLLLVDFSSHYILNPSTQIYLKLDNIFDERATSTKDLDSSLQNRPRTTSVGVKFQF